MNEEMELDVIHYWRESDLCNLKKFALDLLTIPGSSSSVERCFSIASNDEPAKRRRIRTEKLAKMQCLNSFYRLNNTN